MFDLPTIKRAIHDPVGLIYLLSGQTEQAAVSPIRTVNLSPLTERPLAPLVDTPEPDPNCILRWVLVLLDLIL